MEKMASKTLQRNVFTEKLFEAIEQPWSNESTPASTPAKNIKNSRKSDLALLSVDIEGSDGMPGFDHFAIRNTKSCVESLDDEPDFIVWKLAEKLFLQQMRRMSASAFVRWMTEINRSLKSKRLSQKARILHRRKLQLKMFNTWYGSVFLISGFAKKKVGISKFGESRTKRCLKHFFNILQRETLSVHLKSAVIRRCCIRLQRSCIEKWRKLPIARTQNYTKSLKMAYKLCIRGSFREWVYLVKMNRRLESVLRIFQRRMMRKNVMCCFKRWHQSQIAARSLPSKNVWLAHHLDALLRKRSTAVIKAWNRISIHRRQARSVFLKTLCRKVFAGQLTYRCWCLQSAMLTWLEKVRKQCKPDRSISARHSRSSKNVPLAAIFDRWSRCCVVDRRTKSIAIRHHLSKCMMVLKRCYQSWKATAKAFKVAEQKSCSLFKYRSLNRKIRTLMAWKRVLAESIVASVQSADTLRLKTQKRKHMLLWNRWKQRTLRRIALERAYKSRARLRLTVFFSLRTLFLEWKMGILSEQFFARYLMSRFWALWKESLNPHSVCISPIEAAKPNTNPVKSMELSSPLEVGSYSMARIYKRRVLRLAMHGWAWMCSEHSVLLEKLQIAYMIRSSIRACTKHFAVWKKETQQISKTLNLPARPVTPMLEQSLPETSECEAKQRTFEILNIALVERIMWCNIRKSLLRRRFKVWVDFSRESRTFRKISAFRVIKNSFLEWSNAALSAANGRGLKQVLPIFKCWKFFALRSSALNIKSMALKTKRIIFQKRHAWSSWSRHTFGITKAANDWGIYEPCTAVHSAWKNMFFAFRAWHRRAKTAPFQVHDAEAAAKSKYIATMSHNHFNAWRFFNQTLRQSQKQIRSNIVGLMRQIFQSWSRSVFVKRKADKLIVSLQNYQATSLLILCWNAWRAGLEQRNYRTLTLSVSGKLIQKCNAVSVPVRIAWNAWRNFISTRRFVRLAKEKIARKVYEKANFRNMFRRWRTASQRRRKISTALVKMYSATLRRAFFAMKYSLVRSFFFARQYLRISKKFHRHKCQAHSPEFLNSRTQNTNQDYFASNTHPDLGELEAKVLQLQSDKIELMEQLKSALQEMKRDSPTIDKGCKNETQARLHVTETCEQNLKLKPKCQKPVSSSSQHPSIPGQSRGEHGGTTKAPGSHSLSQHPLFPVLSQNECQSHDLKVHQETKASSSATYNLLLCALTRVLQAAFVSAYSSSESGTESDHEADQFLNGILDDDGESVDGIDDVYGVCARPKTASRVNFAASPTGLKPCFNGSNSTARPSSGKRPLSGKKSTPYGAIKVEISTSRPKSAVFGETSTSNSRLKTAGGDSRRPISAFSGTGLRPISAKASGLRERDANIQQFQQWNDSMRVACENSKVKIVQSNGDQYFKERMEQVCGHNSNNSA